jgi:hypothetical protein
VSGRGKDPFGLGSAAPAAQPAPVEEPMDAGSLEDLSLEEPAAEPVAPTPTRTPAPAAVAPRHAPAPSADGGEAQLREALSRASREVIEKIAWEVVPQLAETIIREELERLIKDRETKH